MVPSLPLPSSVRDFASCVGDGAIRVADATACASPSTTLTSSSCNSTSTLSVAASYRAVPLSSDFRLTWAHSPHGPTLSFSPSASAPSVPLRRRWGARSFYFTNDGAAGSGCPKLVVFWDLTAALHDPAGDSPEPHSGYYFVAVANNAKVVLALGDLAAEFIKTRFHGRIPGPARSLPLARCERVVVRDPAAMHTARGVRFAEGGPAHEISVGCSGGGAGEADELLWVSIDGKRAVQARRLRWNFRGNQIVFVDGAPVDVMWDLHGWLCREPPCCAVIMLRARSALESRLWLEEVDAAIPVFSLVVQAFRSPLGRLDEVSSVH